MIAWRNDDAVRASDSQRQSPHDEGSILTMVLALVVIAALIVVPILTYSITVLRANGISVDKREDLEAVRGGARVAIADPVDLFNRCDQTNVVKTLNTPASVGTVSTCKQISEIGVTDRLTIPYAAAALQVGEQVSTQPFQGIDPTDAPAEAPAGAAPDWWVTSAISASEPTADTIWIPNLPERETTVQSADGHQLPGSYDCRVFFPGTYEDPILVGDNAYFGSGVYYFEESVTIVGGADAVAGFGLEEGCVGDLQAVLDIDDLDKPERFNIDGLGATFLLGDDARLIVDDSQTLDAGGSLVPNTAATPLRFHINQRYVQFDDDGGARVSIATVNGDLDPLTSAVSTLEVPNQIHVPESLVVTSETTTESASSKGLEPSTHTPEPRAPHQPTITSILPLGEPRPHDYREGAALLEWAPPVGNEQGGSVITEYEVFDQDGNSKCVTAGELHCVVIDLPRMHLLETTTFTLVARNALGDSDPSEPMSVTVANNEKRLHETRPVTGVVVEQAAPDATYAPDRQPASISWTAPATWGDGTHAPNGDRQFSPPVSQFEVRAYRVYLDENLNEVFEDTGETCTTEQFREVAAPTTCLIYDLEPLDTTLGAGPEVVPAAPPLPAINGTWVGYRFTVTATVPVRSFENPASPLLVSPESAPSANAIAQFDGSGTAAASGPNVIPVAPVYVPDPVVDIDISSAALSEVGVAGYVATPQGRLRVVNPNGNTYNSGNLASGVDLFGGVVSGTYDIDAATFASGTAIGFRNTVLQRKIQIHTTLPGSSRTSTMTLQINQNGADVAVNAWVTQ